MERRALILILIFTVQEAQEEWLLEPLKQKKTQRASETSRTNKPATQAHIPLQSETSLSEPQMSQDLTLH